MHRNPEAIKYMDPSLQKDVNFFKRTIDNNHKVLRYAHPDMQNNLDIIKQYADSTTRYGDTYDFNYLDE